MCGFCGEFRLDGRIAEANFLRMLKPLRQRGPDASGVFQQGAVSFGHQRLSILDLSGASQQPMIDPTLGLAIVFNGCIYNFRDLRTELQAKGYRFFSEGDTEVILKAYHAWGPECVKRFYGMFAFALWERDTGRIMLARDRLGIKPLYYAQSSSALRFASTIPALLAGGDVDTQIDASALHHYLSWHSVVPAPQTILKGVRKLPAATYMMVETDGTIKEHAYWGLSVRHNGADTFVSEAEWRDRLLDALTRAVDRRMVADVPVGALLSGGLDSSLLVALIAKRGFTNLKTFSIGFEAVGGVEGDEFKYSDLVADLFGTDHHRIKVGAQQALDALPGTIAAMSEPMMSHDAVGFYLLSQEVAKHVKVVQSGQGADEIFGGYHWHQKLANSNDVSTDYAAIYFDRDHVEMGATVDKSLMNGDYSRQFIDEYFARCDAGSRPIDKVLQLDTEIMLVDDPVKRVDNMTMAWSLEGRVPFLDHEVVELAARMPAEIKVRNGGKHILKEVARTLVPDEIIDRPKGYFPVPSLKLLRGPFLEFVRETLTNERARSRHIFNRDYVDRLLADPESNLTPKGHSKLWQLAVLEAWLQSHHI